MLPECKLPDGRLRAWHAYGAEGLCECGARRPAGRPIPAAKEEQVRALLASGEPIRRVVEQTGVSRNAVRRRADKVAVTVTERTERSVRVEGTTTRARPRRPAPPAPPAPAPLALAPAHLGQLLARREQLCSELRELDRAAETLRVLDEVPRHYSELADAVVAGAARGGWERAKVVAVLAAALFWQDSWSDDFANEALATYVGDPVDASIDLVARAAEAVIGKPGERAWLRPKVGRK